jgi:hypothetical protein
VLFWAVCLLPDAVATGIHTPSSTKITLQETTLKALHHLLSNPVLGLLLHLLFIPQLHPSRSHLLG